MRLTHSARARDRIAQSLRQPVALCVSSWPVGRRQAMRHGPFETAPEALDAIHDRLESGGAHAATAAVRSSFLTGMRLGKYRGHPRCKCVQRTQTLDARDRCCFRDRQAAQLYRGMHACDATEMAVKPYSYSWQQLMGAGTLAGIGFTMPLFIASEAFSLAAVYTATKIAIFAGSILSAALGFAILWDAPRTGVRPMTVLRPGRNPASRSCLSQNDPLRRADCIEKENCASKQHVWQRTDLPSRIMKSDTASFLSALGPSCATWL